MASVTLKYKGQSSSGRMACYEVVGATAAILKKLTEDGVVISPYKANHFYSPTNTYLAKGKAEFTADVKGFENDGNTINFFADTDKEKQRSYVQELRDAKLLKRMVAAQNAGVGALDLFKAEQLIAQTALVNQQLANLSVDI